MDSSLNFIRLVALINAIETQTYYRLQPFTKLGFRGIYTIALCRFTYCIMMKTKVVKGGCKTAILLKAKYMALSLNQKKEYAWLLFREDVLTQKAIAEKVGVTEKTITDWKDKGDWESKRRSLYNTREDILVDMYLIFENTKNQVKAKGGVANSKDGDAILKLSQAIKNLETETSVAQIFEVCKGLIQHVQKLDFEKSKEIIDYVDSFLKEKLRRG